MRKVPVVVATTAALVALSAPAANADTGTADLGISRLGISQHHGILRVRAEVTDLGPDWAEPAVDIHASAGTVRNVVCTFNRERFYDASDGTTCEVALLQPGDTAGNITTYRVVPGTIIRVTVRTYNMDTTDPNPANDTRTVRVRIR